ncbi:MAG: hypothetical protein ABSF35_17395 [Polyangia bacterium]|jgi:hypothetical protein
MRNHVLAAQYCPTFSSGDNSVTPVCPCGAAEYPMRDFDPYCTDREHDWDQAMSHNDVDHDRGELQDENPESPVVMRAWAQRLLLQGSSQPPIQLPDGEEHVGTSLYNAVARIRRSAPALEAEAELRRILVIEMVRLRRERADSDFWAAARELASETMTCYRLLGRPVLTMGKLSDMRKAAWERWVEAVYERGVDPDQNPDPDDERPLDDQTFERLLRLGPAAANMEGMEAVQFIARFLLASDRLSNWEKPVAAIQDIIAWARCAWPVRHGEEQAIRQVCKNAWNALLPMVSPTVAMVRTVLAVESCTGRQPPKKPSARKRIGLLRLLQRLSAQVRFWPTLGEVELPTEWLTAAKNASSATAIIGISNNTYSSVLGRMAQLGILLPVGEANQLAHQCARFQLRLRCGDDPAVDDAIVADAESLISSNPDQVVETVIAAVGKAATTEAEEAEEPTA